MRIEATPALAALDVQDAWLDSATDEFLTPRFLSLAAGLGMAEGWAPVFLVVRDATGIVLVLPLMRAGSRAAALTTPYTCLWAPLFRPGLADGAAVRAAWLAGRWLRRCAVTRLDAMDGAATSTALLRRGFRHAGLVAPGFTHFAAWTGAVGGRSADAFLADRPGPLRSTLRRKGRRAAEAGLTIHVLAHADAAAAVADYEAVAARSWKTAEPFPAFLRAWMQAACADGLGRVGLLCQNGAAIAAQFWTLRDGRARVHKLVHDEAGAAFSPGTVLTAAMCRAMIGAGAQLLDFGRGDDAYKGAWVSDRAVRSGMLVVAPWRAGGAWALVRHQAGRIRASALQRGPRQKDPQPGRHQADEEHGTALGQSVTGTPSRLDRCHEAQKTIDHP